MKLTDTQILEIIDKVEGEFIPLIKEPTISVEDNYSAEETFYLMQKEILAITLTAIMKTLKHLRDY